jgi:hypothetical protein
MARGGGTRVGSFAVVSDIVGVFLLSLQSLEVRPAGRGRMITPDYKTGGAYPARVKAPPIDLHSLGPF